MAGEMYEVNGQMKWGPGSGCPAELTGKKIQLKCKEGDVFEVPSEAACLSLRVRSLVSQGALEIQFPIRKPVMAKIVEYLRHHKEHAVSEIRTPLVSDNLQDCGATRWDSSYANVDKDMLFELSVAATFLDIPSLFFLLSVKAALQTQNKSADKLRKEYGLANDLPASEEAELRREYAASRKAKGEMPDTDLSQLASSAVTRNAMQVASRRCGMQELLADADTDLPAAVTAKSWRRAMWRAAVMEDWKLLASAPPEVRGDRDLMRGAIMSSQGEAFKYASPELQADEKIVLEATAYFGTAFADAASNLRGSRDFVLKAVGAHGMAMSAASDSLRNDSSLLLEAAKVGCGSALQGASPALRSDRGLIKAMATDDAEAYKYASEDILNDRDFAFAVAKCNGKTLKYMLPKFKADPEIVRAAVTRDPSAAIHAHASRRAELGMIESISGEAHMKEEYENQIKAAQDQAADTTTLAVGGPTQLPLQAASGMKNQLHKCLKLGKTVNFSALSTMMGNMGQANYVAANAYLDKIPGYHRPELDAVTLMWGAVGHIGMRFKAFASADVLNATPEALLTISDASKILNVTCCKMDPPEWYGGSHFDEFTRQAVLTPSAGMIKFPEPTQNTAAAEVLADWDELAAARDKEALKSLALVDRRPIPENFSRFEMEDISHAAPLGGWPSLMDEKTAQPEMELEEGAKVRITGLRAKNGLTGTLMQKFADGKWKVKLDDGSGNALLRVGFFEAIAPSPSTQARAQPVLAKTADHPVDAASRQAAAESRRLAIEERRAKLKEKISSRRTNNPSRAVGEEARKSVTDENKRQQFFIAGTWQDWGLQDMTWVDESSCYKASIQVGSSGCESFQILLDRSWNACLHAGDQPAGQGGAEVKGPDPKWRCEGLNFNISSAEPGSTYEIRLCLNSRGNAHRVEWSQATGKRRIGSAALRTDVSTTPPASADELSASASDGEGKAA
eukprot:TRINITY_DN3112_c0_g2_i1.p1 TRINITY_DN3112_c0_g2~~TRINITY_DN3112_c0_g2_i1.p1  ORF type:complete len:965 (+),score=230.73 TRINITY_DN3112_c0_g2_i1:144-3038(+)